MNLPSLEILLIEDNPADANLLITVSAQSAQQSWHLHWVEHLSTAIEHLTQHPVDLVLLALSFCNGQEHDGITQIHERCPDLPILLLGELEDDAIEQMALHPGVQDYLCKQTLNASLLRRAIRYAVQHTRSQRTLRQQTAAMAAAKDGIALLNARREYLYLNQSHAEVFGYSSPTELIGRCWLSLYAPTEQFYILQTVLPALEQTGHWSGEIVGRRPAGEPFYQELSLTQSDIQPGETGYICIVRDIGDRKQAEAKILSLNENLRQQSAHLETVNLELIQAQKFLEAVLDALSDPVVVKDGHHRWILYNQQFCDLMGCSPEALFYKTDHDFLPAEQADLFWEKDRLVLQTGEPVEIESYMTDRSGQHRYLSTKKSRFVVSDQSYIVATIRDLTQRRQAELALKESEERFRQLAEHIDDVFWLTDPSFSSILYVSSAFEQIWGRSRDQLGSSLQTRFAWTHPEDYDRILPILTQKFSSSYDIEYRIVRPDGSIGWIRDRAFPVYNAQGKPYRVAGITSDITARKQGETEMMKTIEKEKELNELKSRFISIASHEFRTPLTTVLGSAELLERLSHGWTEDKRQKYYRQICSAVQHMTHLLDDVLTLSRAEAGKLPFYPSHVDLKAFCLSLIEELQLSLAEQRQIHFVTEGSAYEGNIDEKLLRQILTNLLSNALKYSPRTSAVQLSLVCDPEMATFTVCDRGLGIPADDLQHLFEPFHRASNVTNIAGTGLGLAIVKRSVEVQGGEITVESEVGVGTRCIVQLPLHQSSARLS